MIWLQSNFAERWRKAEKREATDSSFVVGLFAESLKGIYI